MTKRNLNEISNVIFDDLDEDSIERTETDLDPGSMMRLLMEQEQSNKRLKIDKESFIRSLLPREKEPFVKMPTK